MAMRASGSSGGTHTSPNATHYWSWIAKLCHMLRKKRETQVRMPPDQSRGISVLPLGLFGFICKEVQRYHGGVAHFRYEDYLNLLFLDNFFKEFESFRLEGDPSDDDIFQIDILHRCTKLELHNIQDMRKIKGLHSMRFRLTHLSVSKSRNLDVDSLLIGIELQCWDQLSYLNLSGNKLTSLSLDVLECLNNLTSLDLSRNQFKSGLNFTPLRNLKKLSLAFNHLVLVPLFSKENSLEYLDMELNQVESLRGLERLVNLKYLNMSWNMILHHDSLSPISLLPKLIVLDTRGNPIDAHKKHRYNVATLISQEVDRRRFLLDTEAMSRSEIRMSNFPSASFLRSKPGSSPLAQQARHEGSSDFNEVLHIENGSSRRSRTKRTVASDVISNVEDDRCPSKIQTDSNDKGDQGSDRIVSWRGNPYALALGLSQEVVTEEELEEKEDAMYHLIMSRLKNKNKKIEESECDDGKNRKDQGECETKADNAEAKEDKENNAGKDPEILPGKKSEGKLDSEDEEKSIYDLYPCEEEEETPDLTFMIGVENSSSIEQRFLKFYRTDIREEKLNGETVESWNRINLRGFDIIKEDPPNVIVQLRYSTEYIYNRQKLNYIIEQSSYEALKVAVEEVFDFQAKVAAGREAMNTKTLRCLKCSKIFKHNFIKKGLKNITCEACGSHMLNEYQEYISMPDQNSSKSLESGSSLNEEVFTDNICNSSTPAKPKDMESEKKRSFEANIAKQLFFTTSQNQVKDSPLEKKDVQSSCATSTCVDGLHRSESSSDISVLSNPSESSIEVLGQKFQTYTEPQVKTDALLPLNRRPQAMLESSSSGSMAESTITQQEAFKTSFSSEPCQMEDKSELEVAEDALTVLASGGTEGEISPQMDDSSSYKTCHSDFSSMSPHIGNIASSLEVNESSDKALKFRLKPMDKVLQVIKSKSVDASGFGVADGIVMSKAEQTVDYWSLQESVMEWNYKDFAQIDHRIHLHCELNLTEEKDDCVLLLTKVDLILSSKPGKLFPGLVVMTLNKFHFLRIIRTETENPDEWLRLMHSVKIQTLSQITRSFGVQSLSFEFQDLSENFRAHLLFREMQHSIRFEEFFLKKFREYIKTNATVPVVSAEEDKTKILDHFLDHGIQKDCYFFAATIKHSVPERVCIIMDKNSLFLSSDIGNWIMNKLSYTIEESIAHCEIQQIELFDDQPLKLDIKTSKTRLELGFISEASIHAFLVQLKDIWTAMGSFEDILVIHFAEQNETVSIQHLSLEDSSYPASFDMSDWINIIKQTLSKK